MTQGWSAGFPGYPVNVSVATWNDTSIVITGFGLNLLTPHFNAGDQLEVIVENPQTQTGFVTKTVTLNQAFLLIEIQPPQTNYLFGSSQLPMFLNMNEVVSLQNAIENLLQQGGLLGSGPIAMYVTLDQNLESSFDQLVGDAVVGALPSPAGDIDLAVIGFTGGSNGGACCGAIGAFDAALDFATVDPDLTLPADDTELLLQEIQTAIYVYDSDVEAQLLNNGSAWYINNALQCEPAGFCMFAVNCGDTVRIVVPLSSVPIAGVDLANVLGNLRYGETANQNCTAFGTLGSLQQCNDQVLFGPIAEYSFCGGGDGTYLPHYTAEVRDLLWNQVSSVTVPTNAASLFTITTTSVPSAGGSTSGGGCADAGASVTVSASPSPCYSFVNWTMNGTVASTSPNYTFTAVGAQTLAANFAPVTCTITTSNSPAIGGTSTGGGSFYCGSNAVVVATANTSNGYTFADWTTNGLAASTNSSFAFTVTTNCTVVANFNPPGQSTIATIASPAFAGSVTGGGVCTNSFPATVTATATNGCYAFTNWTENATVLSTSNSYTITVTTNHIFVANFTRILYSIVTSSSTSADGATTGGGVYPCGTNVTVCATPNPCYTFVNWTANGSVVWTLPCYTFTSAKSETLTANFTPTTYSINTSISPVGGGSISGGGTVGCDSNVTMCATPNDCYNFVNWSDQNSNVLSTSACYSFIVPSNETLVANFAPVLSYTITATNLVAAAGSVSGGGITTCGSNVTVCATPNACFNFVNWMDQNSNVLSTSECYSFTAARNETLVANFAAVISGTRVNGSLTNFWSFTNGKDGANPYAALVQGSDGNFYGTTYDGGARGNGTVFRISPGGSLSNLWSFTGGIDGAYPGAGLAQGSDGNFYGTTSGSGSGPSANGTVFRISPGGSLTNLHVFGGSDGANPYGGLVQGSDGNFYGTDYDGGAHGEGTVFRMSPSGSYTSLYSFGNSPTDGQSPVAGLVQGSDGDFYGTDYDGGMNGYGTVFQISPSGVLTTLWTFANGVDGANPYGGLVQGSDGNFYGTTSGSGSGPSGNGTVFRITPSGSLTTLWSFLGSSDGGHPLAGLVQGSDGSFYGTTSGSGSGPSAYGTVFRIAPCGSLTTLWSFTNGVDGASSYAVPVQGLDGDFYGTTVGSGSGPSPNGTVFQLSVPLNPPANQISAIQAGYSNVVLTLPSVAGETYQLQFSSSMTPTNWTNVNGASTTHSIGGLLSLTNLGGAMQPQGFYRFAITP